MKPGQLLLIPMARTSGRGGAPELSVTGFYDQAVPPGEVVDAVVKSLDDAKERAKQDAMARINAGSPMVYYCLVRVEESIGVVLNLQVVTASEQTES